MSDTTKTPETEVTEETVLEGTQEVLVDQESSEATPEEAPSDVKSRDRGARRNGGKN